ncbi:MAG: ABC transporter ATP-binding protein [Lautropia sp.]
MSDQVAADVRFKSVEKRFGEVVAVRELDLDIAQGSFFSLLGPSGCGKTTTLRMIAGFELPSRGDIFIRGKRVTGVPPHKRDIGMVFQNYALFPHLSVAQNVAFGLKMRGVGTAELQTRVRDALETVKLAGMEDRYPKQLSGGQQQRVALARAVVIRPAVLLLDEPLGALDKMLRESMQVELRQMQQRLGITTVFVTHDQEEALTMSDRVAVMRAGKIEQLGPPAELYERPNTAFVASFLGASNFLNGNVVEQAGDAVIVDVSGYRFKVPGATVRAGAPVRLVVRPEKIRLTPDTNAIGLPASVLEIVYRGANTHLYLEHGGERLLVHLQNDARHDWTPVPGMNVRAQWAEASAVLLAPDA